MVLYFSRNLKVLAFGGLGELTNSSLAIERPNFRRLSKWVQEDINHRKLIKYVFGKGKFRWIRKTHQKFISHQKD